MAGMTGVVSWDLGSAEAIESEIPEPGRYFRGPHSAATVGDAGMVRVSAASAFKLVDSNDERVVAMLGSRAPRFERARDLADLFSSDSDATLRDVGSQFAFFYADLKNRIAYVAADAFGSYPIYYSKTGDTLYFSTDLESLSSHPSIDSRLSQQSIYDYLYFSIVPAPSTIFANIHRIPLGHMLVIDRDDVVCRQWYEPAPIEDIRADDLRHSLGQSLADAVGSRWVAQRSACFLSGGLDSSSVSGLASQVSDSPVPAYSIGFPENDYDEMPYARIAASKFGLDHHVHYVSASEIHDNMSTVLNAMGEPFSNASTVSSYVCAQIAVNNGHDNLLAGDGGDELFAGNERYAKQLQLHRFDQLPRLARSSLTLLNSKLGKYVPASLRRVSSYVLQASLPFARRIQYYSFIEQSGYENIFSQRFLRSIDSEHPIIHIQRLFDSAPYEDHLKRMLYVDWRITLADNDLRKVRLACDIAGADVRFPMLDSKVVTVSEKMLGSAMMPRGVLRGFYKQAFKDLLPDAILTKPKHGFGVPVGRWMQSSREFRDFVDAKLESLAERDIVNPGFLAETKLARENDNAAHFGVILWTLIVLEIWLQSKNL